jgi:hypothetical protein
LNFSFGIFGKNGVDFPEDSSKIIFKYPLFTPRWC